MSYWDENQSTDAGWLRLVNAAFDEAWGAFKARQQRHGIDMTHDQAMNSRHALGLAIENMDVRDMTSEQIAEEAIRKIGHIPRRDAFSLECD